MPKRLVKIAKELNVGTATIVEHLNNSGFDIENKPTAKVTEEMYEELLKEFHKSIVIKEQADQLIIGTRPQRKEPAPVQKAKVEQAPPPPKETPKKPPVEEMVETVEKPSVKLKIKGKIDLESTKPKTKSKKEAEAPEPAPKESPEPDKEKPDKAKKEDQKVVEPPKAEDTPAKESPAAKGDEPGEKAVPSDESASDDAAPKETPPTVDKTEEEPELSEDVSEKEEDDEKEKGKKKKDFIRADAPQLKGLKILGKIDADRLKKPKKKKKKADAEGKKSADGRKRKDADSSRGDTKKKRRRKRKKVSQSSYSRDRRRGSSRGRRRSSKKDEPREVSQKEIDEKIKATMARISGKGKKKRQRIRRETRERMREKQEQLAQETKSEKLQLTEFVSVSELASLMDIPVTEVITVCMNLGVIVSINQRLDAEIIELVAEEFGHEIEFISAEEQVDEEEEIVDDPEDLFPRAPIVTVMGHVDHGKTSLLDYIRKANVMGGEAGGITQHIGAYEVSVEGDKKITFLDTPGHEAFTAMRARGAKVTDVAVIIIAADDNIMPQTKEAISHAQAAGVPMVFAINKIDKPGADPERIKQELSSMNFLVEDWGGKYQSQDISAKDGTNVDQLLEKILLEAELLELEANPDRRAIGTVLEASLDRGRGYVAKMLVQTGSLDIGDPIVAGEHSGKVKAMFNERGKRVKSAGPSTPVLVLGLGGAPPAGEKFKETPTEQEARQIASKRGQINREQANRASKRISLDEIGRRLALGTFKELNLIVKGDVDGSIEALSDSLIKLSQETVQVQVIHKAVGQIIESDVLLASASDAIIIGFQVRPSLGARKLAEREGVEIKTYSIIYEAIEQVKAAIEGMLEPTKEEKIIGQLEVREVYKISRVGTVAGCYVQEGKITRNSNIRLVRNGIVIYPVKEGVNGEIASLKRFKDDVKEVKSGVECGVTIKNFNDIKVGDVIEVYEIVEIKQKLKE